MNTAIKSAIALGVASFAVTLWLLKTDRAVPQRDPAPAPSAVQGEAVTAMAGDAPFVVPTDFGGALRAAEKTGSTPEGLKYQDEAGPALSNVLQDRLASCQSDSSPLGQAGFTIVVGVAPDGAVRSSWASPETPLASCILHRLAGAALPRPPSADVWLAANIRPDAVPAESEPER